MKLFFYKLKGAAALALCMCLCSTSVFAKEPVALSAAEQGVKEAVTIVAEEEPLPILTEEEALKKAKRHSDNLRDIQATEELQQSIKEDLWDSNGYFDTSDNDTYIKWIDNEWYTALFNMVSTESTLEQNRYSREAAEIGLQASVKTLFSAIIVAQDSIEATQKTLELQELICKQQKTKYDMGLISKQALELEENQLTQLQGDLVGIKEERENNCIALNKLMGVNADLRYEYVYDVEAYTPYVMTRTMDQYITDAINHSANIKIQELQVEPAEFSYYNRSILELYTEEQLDYDLSAAKRRLKTAKENLAESIRKAYSTIQTIESNYNSMLSSLEVLKTNYRAAQVKFQAGTGTELAVKQAELEVIKSENKIKELIFDHDYQVFTFENPDLMTII